MNVKEKRQGIVYVKSKCTQNTKPPFAPINPHTQMPQPQLYWLNLNFQEVVF